jgi:hypothetical protein
MKSAPLACLAFSFVSTVSRLEAQVPSTSRLEGISVGAGIDRFIYEGTGATAFTYRRSDLKPGRLSPELSVSFFPQVLVAQALLFAPDFGAAYNLSIPHSTLLLKTGASAIVGVATDVVFVPGAHVGAGIFLRIDDRTGIRIDATRHFYVDIDETEAIWSIGFALASLPTRRPRPARRYSSSSRLGSEMASTMRPTS